MRNLRSAAFRAKHCCVVTLAIPERASPTALAPIEKAASRYRVDAVPRSELGTAAALHGRHLPDSLHDGAGAHAAEPPEHDELGLTAIPGSRPDATVSQVEAATREREPRRIRRRHVGMVMLAVMLALVAGLIISAHRSTPCRVQIIYVGGGGTIERCAAHTTASH